MNEPVVSSASAPSPVATLATPSQGPLRSVRAQTSVSASPAPALPATTPPPFTALTGRDVLGYGATLLGVVGLLATLACFHVGSSTSHNAVGVGALGASGACLVVGFRALRRAPEA